MKKEKQNDDGLLSPTSYWEMKLGIKHNIEKVRYKRLCGYVLFKEDKKLLEGAYYITFSNWKEYIDGKLSVLDEEELFEYSKYINGQLQNENIFNGLFSNFMLPLIMAVFSPIFSAIFSLYIDVSGDNPMLEFVSFLLKYVICIIALGVLMKKVVVNAQESKAYSLFIKICMKLLFPNWIRMLVDEENTTKTYVFLWC